MTEILLPLVLFLFPLAYSPGPGNLAFAANGARFGFRATWPATTGYHIATWIVTAALGLGAMELIDRVPGVFVMLRAGGAVYVAWLALRFLRAGLVSSDIAVRPIGFRDGAILLMLNPKAYVIIGLMFSQFLGPEPDAELVFAITTIFTLNNFLAFTLWTLAGDRLLSPFRSSTSARLVNTGFGLMLALVAIWMAL